MIRICKDPSGKTYEYKFIREGKEIMVGDGLTKEEIIQFVKELLDSILEKNEIRASIEIDDEEIDRSFIYENKIRETNNEKNMSFYKFYSDIGEIRSYEE